MAIVTKDYSADVNEFENDIRLIDGKKILFGDDNDCEMYESSGDIILKSLTQDKNIIIYGNNGSVNTEILRLCGSGACLSTGGETSPDVDPGGICLHQGTYDSWIISAKSSDVAHNGVGYGLEADTYFALAKASASGGGAALVGATESYRAFKFVAAADLEETEISGAGYFVIQPLRINGTPSDEANIFVIKDSMLTTNPIFTVKRNANVYIGVQNNDTGNVYMNGTLSTGGEMSPDCSVGGACLLTSEDSSNAKILSLKNSHVSHGMTSIAETDTTGYIYSPNTGGFKAIGLSTDYQGAVLSGYATNSTTTEGQAAITLMGGKKSSTSAIAFASNDHVLVVKNLNTSLLTIHGGGQAQFLGSIATGGETSPDVDPGGICLNQGGYDGNIISFKSSDISHGITAIAETDTFGRIKKSYSNNGGLDIQGLSESDVGLRGLAWCISPSTTSSTSAEATVYFTGSKGTTPAALADNENLFAIRTYIYTRFLLKGNGDTYLGGLISTGAEWSPDVDEGGLCLNQGSNDGNIISLKSSSVTHGITGAETDTYVTFEKALGSYGGLELSTYCDYGNSVSFFLRAYTTTADTVTGTGAMAPIIFQPAKGTTPGALGADDNAVVIRNANGSARQIFKGDGDIYTETDQTSGLTGTYDIENDIMLADRAKQIIGGKWDKKVIDEHKKRLEELGIIKNGFMSHKKMTALNLGTIGQLWNIIRHIAKKFNISENELFEMAKNYN